METNREEEMKEKQEQKPKKKRKWLILLLILLLLGGLTAGLLWWKEYTRPKSKFEMDQNALEGFLPGKTDEEIQNELNRIIAEGRFNAACNSQMKLENGKLDVHIENVPANNYDMLVKVYLINEEQKSELVYESGLIQPQHYIEEGDAHTTAEPGTYDGKVVFQAISRDELQEEIGSVVLDVIITVK